MQQSVISITYKCRGKTYLKPTPLCYYQTNLFDFRTINITSTKSIVMKTVQIIRKREAYPRKEFRKCRRNSYKEGNREKRIFLSLFMRRRKNCSKSNRRRNAKALRKGSTSYLLRWCMPYKAVEWNLEQKLVNKSNQLENFNYFNSKKHWKIGSGIG